MFDCVNLLSKVLMMERMEFFSSLMFFASLIFSFLAFGAYSIESPQFTVVHSESDFEIRLYQESTWMSATVLKEISFDKVTKAGFHRLYQYINGSNANSSRIMITSPIVTSFLPDQHGGLQYLVRFYISTKFNAVPPPRAFPELNLQLFKFGKQCIAVRKFSGFAKNNTVINKEVEALVTDLSKMNLQQGLLYDTNKHGYTIAQYNASFHLSGRLNEVWMNVSSGFIKEGCSSSL